MKSHLGTRDVKRIKTNTNRNGLRERADGIDLVCENETVCFCHIGPVIDRLKGVAGLYWESRGDNVVLIDLGNCHCQTYETAGSFVPGQAKNSPTAPPSHPSLFPLFQQGEVILCLLEERTKPTQEWRDEGFEEIDLNYFS